MRRRVRNAQILTVLQLTLENSKAEETVFAVGSCTLQDRFPKLGLIPAALGGGGEILAVLEW